MDRSFYLGQLIKFQRTFQEPDLHKMTDVLNIPGLMRKHEVVSAILAVSAIMGMAAEAIGCRICLVQQEMIYSKPMRKDERITFRLEVFHIDHHLDWLTFAIKALNDEGEELLRGQVVIAVEAEEMVLHNNLV